MTLSFPPHSEQISISMSHKEDGTFLMLSSRMGRLDIVEKLLAIPEVKDSINEWRSVDKSFLGLEYIQTTPLLQAVASGYVEVVDLLLAEGADPGISDSDGDTALVKAYEGFMETLKGFQEIQAVMSVDDIDDQAQERWITSLMERSQRYK